MLIDVQQAAQEWIRVRAEYNAYQILRVPEPVIYYMMHHGLLTLAEMQVLYEIAYRREIAQWC